jgi:putative transposase
MELGSMRSHLFGGHNIVFAFDAAGCSNYAALMARMARLVVPGLPHHVTQRGVRSMAIFPSDREREAYLQFMNEQCRRFEVQVLAWCLMTNHVHLLLVPPEETTLARAVGEAHKRYTRMRNFADGSRGYLFQGRFGSCVLDERHLLAAARYTELNPVRSGLAARAEDWPWSSARFHLGLAEADPLIADRTLLGLVKDAQGWRELLAEQDGEAEASVRRRSRTGRPAGDVSFTRKLERRTGRALVPGKPGRPKKREK